jgi:hypothetical protein
VPGHEDGAAAPTRAAHDSAGAFAGIVGAMDDDPAEAAERHPREDDRNDELPQSPVPDPEKEPAPGDDPEAD